jgi:hypothetical protein
LLGVDVAGACVVVELKRGQAPREVIAQALEYAAWVDSRDLSDLDNLAREYAHEYDTGQKRWRRCIARRSSKRFLMLRER